MLARVSDMTTAMKRGTIQDYNGPKAVRDHGRVATRDIPFMNVVNQVVCFAHLESKNSAAGDEGTHSSRVIVPNDREITKEEYDKYCARLFEVSSGGAEITP